MTDSIQDMSPGELRALAAAQKATIEALEAEKARGFVSDALRQIAGWMDTGGPTYHEAEIIGMAVSGPTECSSHKQCTKAAKKAFLEAARIWDHMHPPAPSAPDVAGLVEALRQYRHNDGSDGFVFGYDKEMTDRYVAGLAQGGAADLERIRHLVDLATAAHFREMESRTAGLVEALEEIVSPVTFMKKRLKSDEKLEGFYAQQLSSDPNYLKQIAARALAALATFHREG